jgi:hypothetical protein
MSTVKYLTFDTPSTGGFMSYDANIYPGVADVRENFGFGFVSGVEPVLSFSGVNGKLYDNDGNFIYSYMAGTDHPFEMHGNVFNDRHNYSVNRVPVNLNCSKVAGDYIDGFFFTNEEFQVGLSVRTTVED